jgi:hypothetical protein
MAPNLPIEFVFTEEEREAACKEAFRRQAVNEIRGLKGRNGGVATGAMALTIHLLGAAGEMAVASYLGLKDHLYQEAEAKRGSCDLPGNIDVKTRSKAGYDLIVQKDESPEKKFVLVTIENKKTLIHGWICAKDAMKERFWSDPAGGRPAYFVPKTALQPMSALDGSN